MKQFSNSLAILGSLAFLFFVFFYMAGLKMGVSLPCSVSTYFAIILNVPSKFFESKKEEVNSISGWRSIISILFLGSLAFALWLIKAKS
ncbi:MAG: hypothetical protein FWF41_00850 [Betaproteobacteria bacterium]|nr:hypothetical protein [Betaproteobacteria bacterium]